jgi:hypothetical protein
VQDAIERGGDVARLQRFHEQLADEIPSKSASPSPVTAIKYAASPPGGTGLARLSDEHLAGTLPQQMPAKSPVLTGHTGLLGISGHRLLKFWPMNTEIDTSLSVDNTMPRT